MDKDLIDLITKENIKLNMKNFRYGAPLCNSHMTISEFEDKIRDVTISCVESKDLALKDDLLYAKSNQIGKILVDNKKNIGKVNQDKINRYDAQRYFSKGFLIY